MVQQGRRLETLTFKPNGRVPNSRFPVLIYRAGVPSNACVDLADAIEATFQRHDWLNNWRELGVYDYYHFHFCNWFRECRGKVKQGGLSPSVTPASRG